MHPSSTATKSSTQYEHQAREAALAWSQLALSTTDPAFDIVSSQQRDMRGTIIGSHGLSIEHQTRRWYGRIAAGGDDILCSNREEFDERLEQQGLLALYDESAHQQLTESITQAPYAAHSGPAYRPTRARRLLYRQQCGECHASGAQTCPTCCGAGETRCGSCAGAGDETCNSCGGSGQQEVGFTDSHGHHHSEWANCPGCNGNGHVDCGGCGGSGYQTCGTCHRSGRVSCAPCEGTGSFTHIGQVALLHTPTYQAVFDDGTPDASHHVLNFFGHAGFADQATVTLDSVRRVDDTATSTVLNFRYRFQLPAALIKVKRRETILGTEDHSEWTVVGKTPEVIDCVHAFIPLLIGASRALQRATRLRFCLRSAYNQRMSGALNTLLKPGIHQWIIEAVNRNSAVEAIEIQIRRGLDPVGIAGLVTHVTRALKMTYRRRMVLHQAAAMLITLACMFVTATSDASNRIMRWMFTTVPNHGAPWVILVALAVLVVISFHARHRAWLRRSGGDALWARAVSLGHLNVRSASLHILGAMLLAALVTYALMMGQ